MSKKHNLKCWPEYFEATLRGLKPFDARLNDRGFEVGDTVILEEYDPKTNTFSGRNIYRVVTYILEGTDHLTPFYCILGYGHFGQDGVGHA